jgi:hypothetical protein
MKPPTARPIGTGKLLETTPVEEVLMFDYIDNLADELVLAQVQTPPALVVPAPNWASSYPGIVKRINEMIRGKPANPEGLISYSEKGSLGVYLR